VRVLLTIISEKKYRGYLAEFVKKKYIPLEETFQVINDYYLGLKNKSSNKDREIAECLAIMCRK
jgi:hypothetical protein